MIRPDPLGFRIGIDASSEPLLPENDPGEPIYQRAILDFGDDDVFVIAMERDDVFTRGEPAHAARGQRPDPEAPGRARHREPGRRLRVPLGPEGRGGRDGPLHRRDPERPRTRSPTCARARSPTRSTPRRSSRATAARRRSTSPSRPMSDDEFVKLDLDAKIARSSTAATRPGVKFHVTGRPARSRAGARAIDPRHRAAGPDRRPGRGDRALAHDRVGARHARAAACSNVIVHLLGVRLDGRWSARDLNLITLVLGPVMITIGGVYLRAQLRAATRCSPSNRARRGARPGCGPCATPPSWCCIAGLTTMVGFGCAAHQRDPGHERARRLLRLRRRVDHRRSR